MSPDDEVKETVMVYEDAEYVVSTLSSLNKLRRNRHFCDVVLQVGAHEIHAHRPVLACASPYLFDMFSMDADNGHESQYRVKLNGGFDKDAFEHLVDYAYTARLEVPAKRVKAVYVAAVRLKMFRASRKCGEFLVEQLNPNNCIGIRSIPGLCNDLELVNMVDAYIQQEVKAVCQSKEFLALPRVQVEVLRNSRDDMEEVQLGQHLCGMVVEWIKQQLENEEIVMNAVTEKVHMLYVNPDHSLHDCKDIQNGAVDDSDIIQDYKKKSKQYAAPQGRKRPSPTPVPAKPRQLLYSRSTSDSSLCSDGGEEGQWKLIAFASTGEFSLMAIAVINSRIFMMSIKLRLNLPMSTASSSPTPSPTQSASKRNSSEDYCLLSPMNTGRCAVGAVEMDGKLLVCGGYDRGECLKMVQVYNPSTNRWQMLQSMRHSRGRFDITVVGNKVFAVGGCDGVNELASVECFDALTQKWSMLPPLSVARSNAVIREKVVSVGLFPLGSDHFGGVCTLDGKVYCIGGWNGHVGTKRCDVYDLVPGSWLEVAHLLVGRSQAGVCAFKGCVFAVGGCDLWNCLSSVEKYDPQANTWTYVAPLQTARRGCGAAFYNGKLWAVGGSDGSRSLCSVEVFDPETNSWSAGPKLTSCRANVGVAVVADKLYAVGGFTGKGFLNTIEYLDPHTNEWTTFTVNANGSHTICSGGGGSLSQTESSSSSVNGDSNDTE